MSKQYKTPQIQAFNARQHEILSRFPDRSPWGLTPHRAMTDIGRLEIHPEHIERYDTVACVSCQFSTATPDQRRAYGANEFNGKWCPISHDPQKALDDLERGLARVNARALTPEERDTWQAEDAAREEENAKFLAEHGITPTEP